MGGVEENARLHIHALKGQGWTTESIANSAGVSRNPLSDFIHGHSNPWIAARVLRLDLGSLPDVGNPLVPKVGVVRRIQALLYMGWSHEELRLRSGLYTRVLLWNNGGTVTLKTHKAIAELYQDLSHQRGLSERSSTWAKKRGYAGPADWDDIDHDEAPEREEIVA